MKIKGVLFDKDGTLFDFQKTWNAWSAQMIEHFSAGDAGRRNAIADAVGFDLARQAFDLDSIVIAGTNRQVAECVSAVRPDQNVDEIEDFLMQSSLTATVSEATPLVPFFQRLKGNDLKIGVMTNDTEAGARVHLDTVGALDLLDFVAGFDSGFGAKPAVKTRDKIQQIKRSNRIQMHPCAGFGVICHDPNFQIIAFKTLKKRNKRGGFAHRGRQAGLH